ncbi:MAG TPA: hypothetical protein VHI93_07600, partial [Candidatus Thermoplasmatota archaeon]|nr:hypothetical protein [Candidatus Thermoplasmatota archaeon]
PWLRQLHEALRACPRRRSAMAVDAEREWGWSRSTTYHRLARLERVGLVAARDGVLEAREVPGTQARKASRQGRGWLAAVRRRVRRD